MGAQVSTPIEHLDRDKYPALVKLTEELGAIQQAATRELNGAAQKIVVDGTKVVLKRVQGDPQQIQRYADHGQDPALAARVEAADAVPAQDRREGLRPGRGPAGRARLGAGHPDRQRPLVPVPPGRTVRVDRGEAAVSGRFSYDPGNVTRWAR